MAKGYDVELLDSVRTKKADLNLRNALADQAAKDANANSRQDSVNTTTILSERMQQQGANNRNTENTTAQVGMNKENNATSIANNTSTNKTNTSIATLQDAGSTRRNTDNNTALAETRSAEAAYNRAGAVNVDSRTTKQLLDNDLQRATQPGIIKAVDAGSASTVIGKNAESTAAMSMQSDLIRGAIGKGHQATPDGEIFNAPGDFLPGAGARIRGEAVATPGSSPTSAADFNPGDSTKWEPIAWPKNTTKKQGKPVKTTRDIYNIGNSKNL